MNDPKEAVLRLYIHKVLYRRCLETEANRQDTIREMLSVTRPDLGPEKTANIADRAEPLSPGLSRKWIAMFVDRLFETAPRAQLEILCDGSEDNDAALALTYVMFLESQRMEAVVAADLDPAREAL